MDKNKPNGCGPWFLPDIIPDGPDRLFLESCNEHDRSYTEGGTLKDKHDADFALFRDSLAASKNLPLPKRILAYVWSSVYLFFVLIFGFLTYNFKSHKEQ